VRAGRSWPLVVVSLLSMLILSGCGTDQSGEPEGTKTQATPAAPSAAPTPEVGSCHKLTFQQATVATAEQEPVPCNRAHTTVTIAVGALDQIRDGHLLAVDSDQVQTKLNELCPKPLVTFLGGSDEDRELSQFKAAWFTPSLREADLGANWFRCDVLALKGDSTLMNLPTRLKGILNKPAGAQFATCGTGSPDRAGFAKVACKAPHQWRAAKSIQLPADAKYLDAGASSAADQRCKDVAAGAAGNNLKFTWGFTWPPRDQWAAGKRAGICWLPTQ
jgi:hypothetical protein